MSRIRKKNHDLIISVAGACFAQKGYEATKIIDIAKAAEVPKANVFYYFSNKEKLYDAVLNTITKPLLEASKPLEELDDPVEALTQYIHTKLSISRDHPNASKVFANEVMSGGRMLPKEVSEKLLQQSRDMVEKFSSWSENGLMDEVSPQHLMFMLWASTQTYADFSWQICTVMDKPELEEKDFEQAAAFIAQMVIKGCGIRSSSS